MVTVLHFGHTQIRPNPPKPFPTAVACSRPLGVFLATVTHSEPYASGLVAFVGPSLAAGWSSLLCCFCRQLHTLGPAPVAMSPSLAAGCFSLLVCFLLRRLHTLSPMPVALSPSLGLRWRLVALASWVIFLSTSRNLEPCASSLVALVGGWLL